MDFSQRKPDSGCPTLVGKLSINRDLQNISIAIQNRSYFVRIVSKSAKRFSASVVVQTGQECPVYRGTEMVITTDSRPTLLVRRDSQSTKIAEGQKSGHS